MHDLVNYFPQLLSGAWMTVRVSLCALMFGLLLALFWAVCENSRWWILRKLTTFMITVIRGVPELLVLFFIYFGGSILLSRLFKQDVNVNAFIAGVVALGSIFAAYASQTLRGAFAAIPQGQLEAARALGMSKTRAFLKISLPQAWRYALPGLGNLWLVLLKDSALIALIGLTDLMNDAQLAASSTRQPFVFYLAAALLYLILTACSEGVLGYLRKRSLRYGI